MVSILEKSKKTGFKKITIKEIAELAGVSRTTVLRVLSGGAFVNKNTRDRILKIIKVPPLPLSDNPSICWAN